MITGPRVLAVPVIAFALVLVTARHSASQQPGSPPRVLQRGGVELPAGAGLDVLNKRCISCHEADIITQQKLSLTAWTRSVDKMVRWGATVTPEEREVLQPYLAQHFSPRPVASHGSTEAAAATYRRVCLSCHDADIIEQQKLTPTGWTRSVEKMMRWGAAIRDAEKQSLVEYLAARFGPP
jgi:cytochrome c5